MKNIQELTIEDFPRVDPEKFNEWRQSLIQHQSRWKTGMVIWIVSFFLGALIGGVAGSGLPILFFFIYFGFFLLPNMSRINKKRESTGITKETLRKALGGKKASVRLISFIGVVLILASGVFYVMGLSGIESSYGLSYLWISIIVLVIASYTLFKDKVTIIQQEGKYLSRGIITLGIIGLFSFILDLLFIFVDTSSPGRYIRETPSAYMTMCIVALVKLFSSIFLLHISRSTFNSLFTKNGITTLFILIFCISIMGCTSKKTGVIAVIHNADTQTYYIDVATANGDTVTAEYSDELYEKKWDKFSTDLQGMQRCDLEKTFWNKNWLITRVDGRIGIIDKMNIYRVDQLFGSQDGKLLQEQWSGNASIIVDEDTINALYTNINNISRDLIGKGMKVMLIPNDEIKEWKYLKIDSIQKDAIHFNSYFVSPKQK